MCHGYRFLPRGGLRRPRAFDELCGALALPRGAFAFPPGPLAGRATRAARARRAFEPRRDDPRFAVFGSGASGGAASAGATS
ncbi:MAG TPA: hypothetical protein VML54_02425, partial [Candidatus Limnocylindrales bacterium]|nr:hypothetical protein [Candidatus Limnocylindrales bacterium]